jgi:hypothetical protein
MINGAGFCTPEEITAWNGDYTCNCGQTVASEDAANLALAMSQSKTGPDSPEEGDHVVVGSWDDLVVFFQAGAYEIWSAPGNRRARGGRIDFEEISKLFLQSGRCGL